MVLKSKNTINYKIVCQFVGFNIIITLILLIRKKREERSIPVTSSETFKDITLRGLGRDFISFSFPSLFFCCGKRKTKPWHWIGDTFLFRQFERGMSSLSLPPVLIPRTGIWLIALVSYVFWSFSLLLFLNCVVLLLNKEILIKFWT